MSAKKWYSKFFLTNTPRDNRRTRRAKGAKPPGLQVTGLEDRITPTTTLFLDFGAGIGAGNSLTTTVTGFRNIFGPGLPGGGGQLGTGSDMINRGPVGSKLTATDNLVLRPLGYDFDGSGTFDNADITALASAVVPIVQRALEPFDINVVVASAASLAQAQTIVSANAGDASGQFDAYSFVASVSSPRFNGGSVGDNTNLNGIAALDDLQAQVGNLQDEATLTFADNVFNDVSGAQGTSQFNANLAQRLAYTATHESSHTFTLEHTLGSSGNIAGQTLLTSGDVIRIGSVTRENPFIVTRFDLQRDNGSVVAQPDNYLQLRNDPDIGLRDSNNNGKPDVAYVTGTGAHDRITLSNAGGNLVTVSVQAYSDAAMTSLIRSENYAIDLATESDGSILIDGSINSDEIVIDATIPASIRVRGGTGLDGSTNESDRIIVNGAASQTLTLNASDVITATGGATIFYSEVEGPLTFNNSKFVLTGSNGDDNVVLRTTGPTSANFFGHQRINLTNTSSFTFNAGTGSDLLTIDYAAGSYAGPISYDGGAGAGLDSLILQGGSFNTITHTLVNASDGTVLNTGGSTGTSGLVSYFALEPVTDNNSAVNRVFTFTGGSETITLGDDSTAGNGISRIDSTLSEVVNFTNPTSTLVVNTGTTFADVLTATALDSSGPAFAVTLNGTTAADTFNIVSTRAGTTTTVTAGDGQDTVRIGTTSSNGLLTPVAGAVVVDGEVGGADLLVDGSGASANANYSITGTTVTRSTPAPFGGVTYSNLTSLALNVGSGANVVDVVSTLVPTTVRTDGGAGDVVNVGLPGGSLDSLFGAVTIDGQTSPDTVNVNDQGNTFSDTYNLTSTTFNRTAFGGLTYSNVNVLNVNAGAPGRTINVFSTAANAATTVTGNVNPDTFNITGTALAGTNNFFGGNEAGAVGDTFNLIGVPAAGVVLNIDGGTPTAPVSPGDTLNINAQNGPIVIDATGLTVGGFALGANVVNIETFNLTNPGPITVNGAAINDTLKLNTLNATNLFTLQLNAGIIYSFQATAATTSLTYNGFAGTDSFVINYAAGGLNVPMTYNGGSGAVIDSDSLTLQAGTFNTVTHTMTGGKDAPVAGAGASGSVVLSGLSGAPISYTGLEPIADNFNAVNRVFNITNPALDILLDDTVGGDNMVRISASVAETITFPTLGLLSNTINFAAGTNKATIRALELSYNPTTTTFNGNSGDDELDIDYSAGLVNEAITFNGAGGKNILGYKQNNNTPVLLPPQNIGGWIDTYFATGNDKGSFIVDPDGSGGIGAVAALVDSGVNGDDSATVTFTNTQTIISALASTRLDIVMVQAAASADLVSFDNNSTKLSLDLQPANAMIDAMQLTDIGDTLSTIQFANKPVVTFSGGLGADGVRFNATTTAAKLVTLTAFGHYDPALVISAAPGFYAADDNSKDVFEVNATRSPVDAAAPGKTVTQIFGMGGDDLVHNLTNFDASLDPFFAKTGAHSGVEKLDNFSSPLIVDGGLNLDGTSGKDTFAFSSRYDVNAEIALLTNTTLTGASDKNAPITYTTFETFYFESTSKDDTLDVTATNKGTDYLVGGGAGKDTVTVGTTTAKYAMAGSGDLTPIMGAITVLPDFNGTAGNGDIFNIDDSSVAAGLTKAVIDDIGDTPFAVYDTSKINGKMTSLTGFAIVPIRYFHADTAGTFGGAKPSSLEFLNVRSTKGVDVIAVNATTASTTTTLDAREGNDAVTIAGEALSAGNFFRGFDGDDQFNLNIAAAKSLGSTAVYGITGVQIEGNNNLANTDGTSTAGTSKNRDRLTITDSSTLARSLDYIYLTTQGDINVGAGSANNGLFGANLVAGVLMVRSMETLQSHDVGDNNDTVRIFGATTDGTIGGPAGTVNDVLTIGLRANSTSALVFEGGDPYLATAPEDRNTVVPAHNLPGLAGPGSATDLELTGLSTAAGLTVDGNGKSTTGGDRVVVYAASEGSTLSADNTIDFFGFGAGVLIPGFGVDKAYDTIVATDTKVTTVNNNFGALTTVNLNRASFVQNTPHTSNEQAALIVDGGDESMPQMNGKADVITATISALFNIQINGNLPAATGAPAGDVLTIVVPVGDANIFSDQASPPNVTVTDSALPPFGIRFSSIESVIVTPVNGVVNVFGDNHDTHGTGTDQADTFIIEGLAPIAGLPGARFSLNINGSAPITFQTATIPPAAAGTVITPLSVLNVFGGAKDDTTAITPYATALAPWGMITTVDGGTNDNIANGVNGDRLIYTDVANVFDDTHLVATGLGTGRIDAHGIGAHTTDQVIRFLGTEQVSIIANAGDGDALNLDLTNAADTATLVFDPNTNPSTPKLNSAPALNLGLPGNSVPNVANDINLASLFNVALATPNLTGLTINTSAGDDKITVALFGTGNALPLPITINAGAGADSISFLGNATADAFANTPGSSTLSGVAAIGGGDTASLDYTGVEAIAFDGGSGGADIISLNGSASNDQFTINEGTGTAATVQVSTGPAISFGNLGTGSILNVNGGGGDDQITFNQQAGNWGISVVNVDGGSPTASDILQVNGTANPDAFVYTPNTGVLTVAPNNVAANLVTYNTTNIEVLKVDGGSPNTLPGDTLQVMSALTGTVTLPNGSLGSIPARIDYQNMEFVQVLTAPTAVVDNKATVEDNSTVIDVLGNDTVVNLPAVIAVVPTPGQLLHGTAVVLLANDPTNPFSTFFLGTAGRAAIRYTPTANYNGTDTFSYSVTDSNGQGPAIALVNVIITPVNDAPTAVNGSGATPEDNAVTIDLRTLVSDVETAAANFTFAVSNAKNGTVTLTGAIATFTPAANYNGPATFDFTGTDRGDPDNAGVTAALTTTTRTVTIAVTAVNDAPTITVPAAAAIEDTYSPVSVSIADVDATVPAAADLDVTVTLSVGKGTLQLSPISGVVVGSNGTANVSLFGPLSKVNQTLATLQYLGNANVNGTDTITVNVDDGGNVGTGGVLSASTTATITIAAVNDSPVNTVPASLATLEDTAAAVAPLSVADVDLGAGAITVTLSVLHGTLSATGATGTGTASVTFTGTLAATNAVLATVVYTPALNYKGADTLTLITSDSGNTGSGGVKAISSTVAIAVTAVADAPTLTGTGTVAGTEGVAIPLTLAAALTDPSETLVVEISGVPAGTTFNRGINLGNTWRFTPAQLAGLTITVPDGPASLSLVVSAISTEALTGKSATTTLPLTVTVANSNPVTSVSGPGSVPEGSADATVSYLAIIGTQADPSQTDSQAGFHFAYDFDNDGTFDLGGGTYANSVEQSEVTIPANLLSDGAATRIIRARIIDKDGGFSDSTVSVAITNVAPSATFGVTTANPIEKAAMTVAFTDVFDPSPNDTAAGFTYSFDMNNDGIFEISGRSPTATVTKPIDGSYTIRGRITDKDGGTTDYTTTVNVANTDIFAVGAGKGGGPEVQVYNQDGTLRKQFFAYETAYRGGVSVAVADVTGDHIPDIITGTGVGGGPRVEVFDGATFALVANFFAYDSNFRGGVTVSAADLDGDGVSEILTGTGVGGGPRVRALKLKGSTITGVADFFAYDSTLRGGVNVAGGDTDGDGKAEIVTGVVSRGGPHVKIFGADGSSRTSFFAYDPDFRGGVNVAVGDRDGDGKAEIITGAGTGGSTTVKVFMPGGTEIQSYVAFDPNETLNPLTRSGVRVAAHDLDGDGRVDIVAATGPTVAPQVAVTRTPTPSSNSFYDALTPFDASFRGGLFVG